MDRPIQLKKHSMMQKVCKLEMGFVTLVEILGFEAAFFTDK